MLEALGINKDGSQRRDAVEYMSTKRTVNKNKMRKIASKSKAKLADHEAFSRYRKEEYYGTLAQQKADKLKRIAEAKEETNFVPSYNKGKNETPSYRA